jgi:hypothetical protein
MARLRPLLMWPLTLVAAFFVAVGVPLLFWLTKLYSGPQIWPGRISLMARQDSEEVITGTDFVEFAADGRISRITNFHDK